MVMPEGVIVGAWSYVIAGYGLTALVLLGYAWTLWRRGRTAGGEREDDR